MEIKDIIHQNGGNKFFAGSSLSMRSFLRHLITLTYLGLVLFTLFNIHVNMADFTSNNFKEILQSIIIIFFFASSAITSLKISNQSFKSFFVTAFFILGMGAGTFAIMTIRSDQPINEWEDLAIMGYIYAAIPIYTGIWKLTIAIIETKSSPLLSRKLFYNGVADLLYALNILAIMFYIHLTYLATPKINFNLYDNKQMLYMLGLALINVLYILVVLIGWKKYGKQTIKTVDVKTTSLSFGIIIVIPLAIWLLFKSFMFRDDWRFYLYLATNGFLIMILFLYSFLRKTELGSPKIYTILVTMIITIIWTTKFIYGYQFGISMPEGFTLTVSLSATSLVLLIQYFKSPNISKMVAWIYMAFAAILFILSLSLWLVLHFAEELDKIKAILDIPELLNALLLVVPTALMGASILSWSTTMSRIKKYSLKKQYILNKKTIKKIKREDMIKEVLNAK